MYAYLITNVGGGDCTTVCLCVPGGKPARVLYKRNEMMITTHLVSFDAVR